MEIIDHEAKQVMLELIKRQPGYINIGMDGATVNGKQKVYSERLKKA